MRDLSSPRNASDKWRWRGLRSRPKASAEEVEDANERLRSVLASVSDCYFTLNGPTASPISTRRRWTGSGRIRTGSWAHASGTCAILMPSAASSSGKAWKQRHCVRREVMSGLRPGHLLDLHVCPSTDGLSVFFTDVTERRAAKTALDELAGRVLSLQNEERQRIAEELHDSTAQHLAAVVLHLMRLRQFVLPEGHKVLDEAEDSVDEAARELRAFTYLLHPPGLEHGGLAGTVRAFAAGFARRTGLDTSVHMPDDGRQPALRHPALASSGHPGGADQHLSACGRLPGHHRPSGSGPIP